MKNLKLHVFWAISVLLLTAGCASTSTTSSHKIGHLTDGQNDSSVGFLVVAPDRGFLGNEELREAFAELAAKRNAALVFIVDERSRRHLEEAIDSLHAHGASRLVALPLFVTESHPRWLLARRLLEEIAPPELEFARRFGASYLAAEVLSDHFRAIADPVGRRVVVVGYGATDAQTQQQMAAELTLVAKTASVGFGFEDVQVVVWHKYADEISEDLKSQTKAALQDALADGQSPVIVPFHLGSKYDGMMSFTGFLAYGLPEGTELLKVDITPHPAIALWMQREANRASLAAQDLGVVVLAHGSDFFWNETIRKALEPVTERYPTEFAFSMADQPIVERAIQRLEARGVSGIVIIRVFGMAASFRHKVERMIGADVELGLEQADESGMHRHGMAATAPPPRIRSAAVITTVGGLEDHALFAEALTARAFELSRDPGRETLILVAHGLGDDKQNDHWLQVLESLASQMRADGAHDFRAIEVATWREDWPDKHEPWLARVREQVQKATENEGLAIVIPARTNARGGERELLDGLDFELGQGFAPHPLFARWVEDQIQEGQAQLIMHTGNEKNASRASK